MAGYQEILLLIGIALLLFGPDRIPELARSLGKATTEYRKGVKDAKQSIFQEDSDDLSSEDRQLIKAAKDMGLTTEGRSIEEIANDIINN